MDLEIQPVSDWSNLKLRQIREMLLSTEDISS